MALSGQDTHRRLRPEVDQLAPEVTLVLWHVLVQGGWQTWVVPGRSLRVVVDEVNTGSICEPHFPATWKRAQLGYRLLLNTGIVVLATIHPDVLLPPWVNPSCGSGVVVDKVWAAFRSEALLPSWGKLAGSGACSPGGHHRLGICALGGLLSLVCRGTGPCSVLCSRQGPVLMPLALNLLGLLLSRRIDRSTSSGPVPARCARVMINVVCTAQVIFATFPARRQTTLYILKWTECAVRARLPSTVRWRL